MRLIPSRKVAAPKFISGIRDSHSFRAAMAPVRKKCSRERRSPLRDDRGRRAAFLFSQEYAEQPSAPADDSRVPATKDAVAARHAKLVWRVKELYDCRTMVTLKIILLASLFIATGGAVASEMFRRRRLLVAAAGIIAIIGSFYLFDDVYHSIAGDGPASLSTVERQRRPPSTSSELTDPALDRSSFKVDSDGYGLVQLGMSLSDAYAALGLEQFERSDVSGFSVSDSACLPVAPAGGELGIEFLFVRGHIARIDINRRGIQTTDGLQIGSAAQEIERRFPGRVRIERHMYEEGAYYYIVDPTYSENEFVFEVKNGRVIRYRVGSLPAVEWVERCL